MAPPLSIQLVPYKLKMIKGGCRGLLTSEDVGLSARLLLFFCWLFSNKVHPPLVDKTLKGYISENEAKKPIVPEPIPKGLKGKISIVEYLPSSLSSVPGPYQVFFILPLTEQANISSKTLTLYLPGGAYIRPPLPLHFSYLYELCSSTGSPICLACYPIAPLNNLEGNNVISDLTSLIKQLRIPERRTDFPTAIQEQLERCNRFCLYGDSAAGGLAFSLAFHLAQDKSDEELKQPDEIIANAPWVDLTCSHPELDSTSARHDPWLSPVFGRRTALAWAGLPLDSPIHPNTPPQRLFDPLISPYHASSSLIKSLAPHTRISIICGTYDMLYPEARDFAKRLETELGGAENERVAFKSFDAMLHAFILFPVSFKQRNEGRAWVERRLLGK